MVEIKKKGAGKKNPQVGHDCAQLEIFFSKISTIRALNAPCLLRFKYIHKSLHTSWNARPWIIWPLNRRAL